MDGPFYIDTRTPHVSTDIAAVTLSTTNKAIVPIANLPILGSNYFNYVGKAVRLSLFGRFSTGATPGLGQWNFLWGNGTDANGTPFLSSPGASLAASQSNMSWWIQATVRCRALGVTGSLIGSGIMCSNYHLWATASDAVQTIPYQGPVATTLDLTQSFVISPQASRNGSTAETIQVHEFVFEALN